MPRNAEQLPAARPGRRAAVRCGATGVIGAFVCVLTCCLPPALLALGAGGSAAAGMTPGGSHGESHGAVGDLFMLLHRVTPGLLAVSIVLIGAAFALRRPAAVIPALLAGVCFI